MATVLCSWLGFQDLKSIGADRPAESPLLQIALQLRPSKIRLLWCESGKSALSLGEKSVVLDWVAKYMSKNGIRADIAINTYSGMSHMVMNFEWIYEKVDQVLSEFGLEDELLANATSGTSIMTAAWIVRSRAVPKPILHLYINTVEQGVAELPLPDKLWIDMESIIGVKPQSTLARHYFQGSLWGQTPLFEHFLGNAESIMLVKERAFLAAQFGNVPVLILGAPGTGKSQLAQEIHNMSRRKGRCIPVDCGHLSGDTEIHSIFGWCKGSFTGADKENKGLVNEAAGGTLFLDEIGNLPISQQSRLLRFIQTKKYRQLGSKDEVQLDVRVVAATNANLQGLIREGTFRQDLYDRLSCVMIRMPALHERRADIFSLAKHKLQEFQDTHAASMEESGVIRKHFSSGVETALRRHDWPGNVRELEHLVARLVIFSDRAEPVIGVEEVLEHLQTVETATGDGILNRVLGHGFSLDDVVEEVQRHYVVRAASQSKNNKTEMARLLGYGSSRTPLLTLIKRLGLSI